MVAILIVTVLIGVVTIYLFKIKKKEWFTEETDYRVFFILGISFLPMGIIFTSTVSPAFISFIGLGICYMAIGLANRDKWKKEE